MVPKPPGFSLMTHMLNDTPMLRMVSSFELCFKLIQLLKIDVKLVIVFNVVQYVVLC